MPILGESNPTAAGMEIDCKNLRFYADMFHEHEWSTVVIHWGVFGATLREIAERYEAMQSANSQLMEALRGLVAAWELEFTDFFGEHSLPALREKRAMVDAQAALCSAEGKPDTVSRPSRIEDDAK